MISHAPIGSDKVLDSSRSTKSPDFVVAETHCT
jgi:hypothetical protein